MTKWLRPLIVAAASAALFIVLEVKARDLESDIAMREGRSPVHNAAAQLTSLPIIGGLFGFVAPVAETVIDPQLAADKLELAAMRFAQGLIIIVGGAVVIYFLWKDVIQTPAQKAAEIQRQAIVTEAAVRGALGTAQATPVGSVAVPVAQAAAAPVVPAVT